MFIRLTLKFFVSSLWVLVFFPIILNAQNSTSSEINKNTDESYGKNFSMLPLVQQQDIINRVAPPKTSERDAPYSTPMYYLLCKGYRDGVGSMSGKGNLVLQRNRPDWQEALIKDWVELGLTSTHFLTYPGQWQDKTTLQAIDDYFALSAKYDLKIGIRLGGDHTINGLEGSGWDLHPNNPDNRLDEYKEWVKQVATRGKGLVDYYVLGDELNLYRWEGPTGNVGETRLLYTDTEKKWTPEIYMQVFTQLSNIIKSIDPDVNVSMFGMGGLDWEYLHSLFQLGYADYADGVAANIGNKPEKDIQSFVNKGKEFGPDFKFYSNGVGYLKAKNTNFYPTNVKGVYEDEEQGIEVAKVMFRGFDAEWDVTPYYIVVRQWQLADSTFAPHWYGMMGFMDLVLDAYENLTFKHYPAWYSFQTISHIFYSKSKSKTKPAPFAMDIDEHVDFAKVYKRNNYECLLVMWNNDDNEQEISITLPTQKFKYPVQVSLFNYNVLEDIDYQLNDKNQLIMPHVLVGQTPVIIRLVAKN